MCRYDERKEVRFSATVDAARGLQGAAWSHFFFCSFRFEGTVVERFLLKLNMFAFQVEDCEKAYFKMDNVLIDDRRIHVDFSQSVSKIKWKGKGVCVCVLSLKCCVISDFNRFNILFVGQFLAFLDN